MTSDVNSPYQDLSVIRENLDRGTYSCRELTETLLSRIDLHDSNINAFITLSRDEALAGADAQDALIARGEAGPLTGIPIAHKDIFCTEGVKTSAGSRMLDNFTAPYSATVVERLEAAGCVTLGKTNLDEFAMGSSNENSFYGPVKNPWATSHVPGGSSGGSAAAVAAGFCPVSTGTDTGGSIRQPASMCGVTGIKPTYGRVSRWGMIAFASSLDQAGVFARSARDAAVLLSAMTGADPRDSTCINEPAADLTRELNTQLSGLRVGIPEQYMSDLDSQMSDRMADALREMEQAGATLIDISLPHTRYAVPAYYVIAPAECSTNLSRYDGVRFGYRCEDPADIEDLYKRSRSEAFGDEVKQRILVGTFTLSAGYYDAYYHKAQQIRRLIHQDFDAAFNSVDVIAAPTCPGTAFQLGEKISDNIAMYLQDIYTIPVNLAGLPGLSMPVGKIDDLPVGMQLIGRYLDEARLLGAAHQFQQRTDWHLAQPTLKHTTGASDV
ncbi:MAG: Asp-tRNA(Asn)/Glu-tRNA(Gln) amidotransferase GatCAB subunit A [Gammaproteobacteria bacterium]|nr:Asp-tRNA(Asn)/Glu-tRNA(Gln) amidotransferase GatCAB subunit A [Gammaproteobacteria bacterium]RPG27578.1 MAG: Asp-tRNA(Asn)/Glu-tRNA(Gln) amidotransferase subunit GatA [Gammaproteobacteria bacterium TMED50]|tara:strand:+ start:9278 stop:10768 length:1491 start_codon:yes stop_codon:yes gene_type:complete